ncbi:fish-egg lectin-like [Dendropsophus ebraccatus]|uniref:fish-egg lectin-like n=1 Tax=Dendropsophus ebraccatus TaxID=150705 RepID=UPI003831B175
MIHIFGLLFLCAGAAAVLQCTVIPGKLRQIDAGADEVYGVNDDDNIYQWVDQNWKLLPGKLIHVSVGPAGVWGVNRGNTIYKFQDGNWVAVNGALKQIDAGGEKFASGVNSGDGIYCLNQDQVVSRSTVLSYTALDGSLKYYSCGPYGCWGVNSNNDIWYRHGVQPTSCRGSRWQQIDGKLIMVEVSTDGSVYGVNSQGQVYKREGISASNPIGTSWTREDISGSFRHVSYDQGNLWLLTMNGDINRCKTAFTEVESNDLQCTVIPGKLKQIDAGTGEVYGVNDDDNIYQWVDQNWKLLPGKLIHVSVGPAGIWGVNRGNTIYKLQDGNWVAVNGALKQIDAGGNKFASGVNSGDGIYCLNQDQVVSRSTVLSYTALDGSLKYYSCGPYGCWGVNSNNDIWYRHGVDPTSCRGSRWQQIDGKLIMVEVSTDGSVYGVNSQGQLYKR